MTSENAGGLDFGAYQRAAARTGGVVATDHPIVYPTLGLANEAGEVAGKVKKIFRDRQGQITDADRQALVLEPGGCAVVPVGDLHQARGPAGGCGRWQHREAGGPGGSWGDHRRR